MTLLLTAKKKSFHAWAESHPGWGEAKRGIWVPRHLCYEDIERRAAGASQFHMVKKRFGTEENLAKAFRNAEALSQFKALNVDPEDVVVIAGVANANITDRMDERLEPTGAQLAAFHKNPILLRQHDHNRPIGTVPIMRAEEVGLLFEAIVGDPKKAPLTGDQVEARNLIGQNVLRAGSIGFIPLEIRPPVFRDDGSLEKEAVVAMFDLLEHSVVSVPANQESLHEQKGGSGQTVVYFPGKSGSGSVNPKKGSRKMDEELKEIFKNMQSSLDSINSGIKAVKEGQDAIQKGIDGLQAPGKGAGKEDDEEKEDEDSKSVKKRVKALEETVKGLKDEVKEAVEAVKSLTDSVAKMADVELDGDKD